MKSIFLKTLIIVLAGCMFLGTESIQTISFILFLILFVYLIKSYKFSETEDKILINNSNNNRFEEENIFTSTTTFDDAHNSNNTNDINDKTSCSTNDYHVNTASFTTDTSNEPIDDFLSSSVELDNMSFTNPDFDELFR